MGLYNQKHTHKHELLQSKKECQNFLSALEIIIFLCYNYCNATDMKMSARAVSDVVEVALIVYYALLSFI